MLKTELEIARAEVAKHEFMKSQKSQKKYAWIVLMIIMFCNVSNQWQRSIIAVAYQITPDPGDEPNPKTMI